MPNITFDFKDLENRFSSILKIKGIRISSYYLFIVNVIAFLHKGTTEVYSKLSRTSKMEICKK